MTEKKERKKCLPNVAGRLLLVTGHAVPSSVV